MNDLPNFRSRDFLLRHMREIMDFYHPACINESDGGYFNFVESSRDVDAILPPDVCDRLREVKRRYDPENRIVANHTVSLEV